MLAQTLADPALAGPAQNPAPQPSETPHLGAGPEQTVRGDAREAVHHEAERPEQADRGDDHGDTLRDDLGDLARLPLPEAVARLRRDLGLSDRPDDDTPDDLDATGVLGSAPAVLQPPSQITPETAPVPPTPPHPRQPPARHPITQPGTGPPPP
jgi:hypothetical protein